jgi:NADH-quinone oxidoreductase subunit A
VEIAFFFPWATVFRELSGEALAAMGFFVLVLVAGFIYAWRQGAFQWE